MAFRVRSVLRRLLHPLRPARAGHVDPGRAGATATVPVRPPNPRGLVVTYAPETDGSPDAGEIVWTWVPYAEGDGRGKDRPVLVIARHRRGRVYAVRLTTTPHPGSPDHVALGSGEWDARGRASWVDLRALYSVREKGMRREAAALDRARFRAVAAALRARYGWRTTA